jgi:ubiquitin-conjugating enzyme E2 variant
MRDLPALDQGSRAQQIFWGVSIAVAFCALTALALRIAMQLDPWAWWMPLALAGGIAAADLGSGLVHWGADTWGRDDLPVIGQRLLVPFRVHHVNPDDFLRRSFIDTNGDVALITIPAILALLLIPLEAAWAGPVAVFGVGLCGFGMMTNQIHQWAHMPSPPFAVRLLQDCGVILGRTEHATHHARPYDAHYCITTGWCNRPIEALGLFRLLEAAVTRMTGARPRHDDARYEERYGVRA